MKLQSWLPNHNFILSIHNGLESKFFKVLYRSITCILILFVNGLVFKRKENKIQIRCLQNDLHGVGTQVDEG